MPVFHFCLKKKLLWKSWCLVGGMQGRKGNMMQTFFLLLWWWWLWFSMTSCPKTSALIGSVEGLSSSKRRQCWE